MRLCLVIVLAASLGCGKSDPPAPSPEAARKHKLSDLWDLYSTASKTKGRPPAGPKELAGAEATNPEGWAALQTGECVLLYGGPAGSDPNTVLAYEKAVPAAGGQVLMQNGQIKELTAAEFAAAPKAGGKK